MHHDFPKLFKGNYPFAVLHAYRTGDLLTAGEMAIKLCKEPMSGQESWDYVAACLATKGNPQILDLIEGGE